MHYRQAVADYNARNFTAAAANFRLAAEQGHAESQYLLSTLLDSKADSREDSREDLPQDATEAAFWERKAAEEGHAYA